MNLKNLILLKLRWGFSAFFLLILFSGILYSQNNYFRINDNNISSVQVSSFTPALNQTVTIKIHFKNPVKLNIVAKAAELTLNYDTEVLKGKTLFTYNKDKEITGINAVVKFRSKRVYDTHLMLVAEKNKSLVDITFYVGGAFRESLQVQSLRKDIEFIKTALESINLSHQEFKSLVNKNDNLAGSFVHSISYANDYERNNSKTLLRLNTVLYNTLLKEYNTLKAEGFKRLSAAVN